MVYRAGRITTTSVNLVSKADNFVDIIIFSDKLDTVNDIVRSRKEFPWHHIFPQRADLAKKFLAQNIDIHKHLLELPLSDHIRIHSGAPRGGLWNLAWENFIKKYPEANAEQIYIYAGWLIYEFGLDGIGRIIP
jgi:uncharacterized lipoprotein (TIGR02269 family)